MEKKKEILDLYGETFVVQKEGYVPLCRSNSIYTAYNKPSARKVYIWKYWEEWKYQVLRDGNDISMWISSYNCNFFTIGGVITTPTNEIWYFYITATRQEVWRFKSPMGLEI